MFALNIGIYGGTFNPPHLGHFQAAKAAVAALKLDKLILVPAAIPPHKDLPAGSPCPEQRMEMVEKMADALAMLGVVGELAAAMLPVVAMTAVFNAILAGALYLPIQKALKLN